MWKWIFLSIGLAFIFDGLLNNTSTSQVAQPTAESAGLENSSTVASPAECLVNQSGFSSLQTGDSYLAAVEKLGCEGVLVSRSEILGTVTEMYQWYGNGFGANMNAMFQGGGLISKAQFGLR